MQEWMESILFFYTNKADINGFIYNNQRIIDNILVCGILADLSKGLGPNGLGD